MVYRHNPEVENICVVNMSIFNMSDKTNHMLIPVVTSSQDFCILLFKVLFYHCLFYFPTQDMYYTREEERTKKKGTSITVNQRQDLLCVELTDDGKHNDTQ